MVRTQRGLGTLGLLLVIGIAAVLGYYAYKNISGTDEPESCAAAYAYCMKVCNGTATEAPAAQTCQENCERERVTCERRHK